MQPADVTCFCSSSTVNLAHPGSKLIYTHRCLALSLLFDLQILKSSENTKRNRKKTTRWRTLNLPRFGNCKADKQKKPRENWPEDESFPLCSCDIHPSLKEAIHRKSIDHLAHIAMSTTTATFSKNPFDLLNEDGEVRPQPVAAPLKEEKKAEQPKARSGKSASPKASGAARAGKGSDRRRGGARQGNRPPRREFDRHSGTGLVDSEKKEKQGWGHAETAEAEAAADSISPKDPAAADEATAEAAAEPEEVVKTLEEYLAEKANKSLKVSLPEARKPNEGADDGKWKDAVAFSKTEEPELFATKEKAKKAEKPRKEKQFVEIEQRFQERNTRGGFRGNDRRGGERRGRGNGRRGNRQSNGPVVNLQDTAAFPSLGATA
ncbi:uncharacterized protein BYT42DRAFT_553547 [Radiomyces spectabilis]|uniref:uncharacterized protein n=1 Tax=Radiomyces spectabilis TaxID=64574 RepID=UPI00221EB989|nr:uncharacterized protein BYT42DRAFT_553547 [Radiomyces spectabilis]KAI8394153.1 hypothetical protein BYT42DRAFT_553547 [Radiomyces spectabilis]